MLPEKTESDDDLSEAVKCQLLWEEAERAKAEAANVVFHLWVQNLEMQKTWGVTWDVGHSGLTILEIREGGFLHKWNKEHPERQIHCGDSIFQLGSFRTDGTERSYHLTTQMMFESPLMLTLTRPGMTDPFRVSIANPWR